MTAMNTSLPILPIIHDKFSIVYLRRRTRRSSLTGCGPRKLARSCSSTLRQCHGRTCGAQPLPTDRRNELKLLRRAELSMS